MSNCSGIFQTLDQAYSYGNPIAKTELFIRENWEGAPTIKNFTGRVHHVRVLINMVSAFAMTAALHHKSLRMRGDCPPHGYQTHPQKVECEL